VRAHEIWELDFKEIWLADGTAVSVLDIVDKATGVYIGSFAIDVTREQGKRRRKVTWREVQQALRLAFQEWGRPERIQTDKELVFEGHPADLYPSRFQQWLVGLGIQFERTRPGRPQDQGRVERGHRTLFGFACSEEERQDLAHFRAALSRNRYLYNHKFPSRAKSCQGQPPLVAHPEALMRSRPYQPDMEWHLFSLDRVAQLLADRTLQRKVNAAGQISLGNRLYYVGQRHAGRHVYLRFDVASHSWGVFTEEDKEIKRFRPPQFTKSDFLGYYPLLCTHAGDETVSSTKLASQPESRILPWLFLLLIQSWLSSTPGSQGKAFNGVLKNEPSSAVQPLPVSALPAWQQACQRMVYSLIQQIKSDVVNVPPP